MTSTISLDDPPAPQRSRSVLLRRTLTTAIILAAAAVFLTCYVAADPRPALRPPSDTVAAPAPPVPDLLPRLITPASVAAGSTVVMLVYRDSNLCGHAQVRLDGALLPVTSLGGAAPKNHIFISIQIPTKTPKGPHRVELYGPMGTVGGVLCGTIPEHQARIATATIAVRSD